MQLKFGDRVLSPYGEGVVVSLARPGHALVTHDTLIYGGAHPRTPTDTTVLYQLEELRPPKQE